MGKQSVRRHPIELRDRAKVLFLKGENIENIGREIGVPGTCIHQWASRGGWRGMRQELRERTEVALIKTATRVSEDMILAHQKRIHSVVNRKIDTLAVSNGKKSADIFLEARALKQLDDVARRNLGLDDSSNKPPSATINLTLGTADPKPVFDVTPK